MEKSEIAFLVHGRGCQGAEEARRGCLLVQAVEGLQLLGEGELGLASSRRTWVAGLRRREG